MKGATQIKFGWLISIVFFSYMINELTTKLSMMKSSLAIFMMDLLATNAFFSAVKRIV